MVTGPARAHWPAARAMLPPPSEEELDLLDLAPDATDTSRLGCQVKLTKEDLPSVEVVVPSEIRDARAHD
ncbi:unnamed protein product [Gongylonema pulchrum]|uniref:2Fe-2S ferredoxin-type domain-containing protein n=1 Tax=Gongylonema pulchrum TaxID=637853 RepID=A0A183DIW3_9BILA|nr:unnamed protein product [Gongylonema pulchrum]